MRKVVILFMGNSFGLLSGYSFPPTKGMSPETVFQCDPGRYNLSRRKDYCYDEQPSAGRDVHAHRGFTGDQGRDYLQDACLSQGLREPDGPGTRGERVLEGGKAAGDPRRGESHRRKDRRAARRPASWNSWRSSRRKCLPAWQLAGRPVARTEEDRHDLEDAQDHNPCRAGSRCPGRETAGSAGHGREIGSCHPGRDCFALAPFGPHPPRAGLSAGDGDHRTDSRK